MFVIDGTLERLGFSPSEIKVYLHLLRKGTGYANSISSGTGINRTNVYEALDRLVGKGVISYITRNKVKVFEAKSPELLKVLVEEKETELSKTKARLFKDLKELKKSIPKSRQPLEAGIVVGRKGLRALFEEILGAGEPLSFLAADLQFRYFFGPYFFQWHKKRKELGIRQRTIFSETVREKVIAMPLWQRKFIGKEYTSPTTTIIYGGTCVFVQWSEEPLAIKIQNQQIAKSHMNYFNRLWSTAKE